MAGEADVAAPDAAGEQDPQESAHGPKRGGPRRRPPHEDAHILALPPESRSALLVAGRAGRAEDVLRQKGRCPNCALVLSNCICEGLASLRSTASVGSSAQRRVRFALWMHASERARASNTGKLLQGALPEGCCDVFIHGMPGEVERLQQAVREVGQSAYVLFPSPEAVSLAEAIDAAPACDPTKESSHILIVLIDGTWHQAKRMRKALEGLPHVALTQGLGNHASQFNWRRQSEASRVTTAEAAAALLEELPPARDGTGQPDDDQVSQWISGLRSAVERLDEALRKQSHYTKEIAEPREPWMERQLKHMMARLPERSDEPVED